MFIKLEKCHIVKSQIPFKYMPMKIISEMKKIFLFGFWESQNGNYITAVDPSNSS